MTSNETVDDIVRSFSETKLRFESIVDDPRLYKGTADALAALGEGGPVEFPSESSTVEERTSWWKTMGPAFAGVMGGWAGEVPEEISNKVIKTDLDYDGVPVRILKSTNSENLPVVVYLHGGGFSCWSYKDPAFDGYLTRLAALGDCIIVAVDFRLADEHPFPAGLDDCCKVTKWVVEGGASEAGVPAGKVIVAGDSAGANLAFGVGLKAKNEGTLDETISGLYYICPYFAGVGKSTDYPCTHEFDGYFISKGFLDTVCMSVCKAEEKEEWFKSPLLWPLNATEEDLTGLPATRNVVMQLDMIRDMGIAMHYKLNKAGVDSSFCVISGGVHEQQLYTAHSPQVTDQSIRDLAGFAKYVS